jgi:excisionase family DNA binding protein
MRHTSPAIVDLRQHRAPYVTTTDLAAYWRVSRRQIYNQIEAGHLHAIRPRRHAFRIQTADALKFEELARMSSREEQDSQVPRTAGARVTQDERQIAADRSRGAGTSRPKDAAV